MYSVAEICVLLLHAGHFDFRLRGYVLCRVLQAPSVELCYWGFFPSLTNQMVGGPSVIITVAENPELYNFMDQN